MTDRRVLLSALVVGGALGVAAVVGGTDLGRLLLLATAPLALVVLAVLAARAAATVLFTGALVMQVFSGNWGYLGLPIGLDRLLLAAAVFALLRDRLQGRDEGQPFRFSVVHAALLTLMAVAVLSAAVAGTLLTIDGSFALLDRLGLIPFLAFALAPKLYGTPEQRNVLLVALVVLGGYLGLTALAEGLGLDSLVLPGYIVDETAGIHFGRARGPFVEAVAMGFGLLTCCVAALTAMSLWPAAWQRTAAASVALLCATGSLFTLTRAIWLGAIVALCAAALVTPALRRSLVPVALGAAAVVVGLLFLVPGLSASVNDRASDQRPLWDRYNSNVAALSIIESHPLTGVGWQRFTEVSADFTTQADDYPVTGVGIEVHNVVLSHAAELGLPAAALFVFALTAAVVPPILRRGGPRHAPWRRALLGVGSIWFVVAMFGPLSYAFANTALWLFAGIAWTTSREPGLPHVPVPARVGAA